MNTPRIIILISLLALSACKVDEKEVDPETEAQIDLCVEVCFKALCDPAVDPVPDFEQQCEANCTDKVALAQEQDCTELYQDLLECANELPCDDYSSWYDKPLAETCPAEAEALAETCPDVSDARAADPTPALHHH